MSPSDNSDPKTPPNTVTESYNKLFCDRLNKYKYRTPAAGLFYRAGHGQASVRIEATSIRIEFVDVFEFGRDPEGDLFYDDFSKLDGPVDYRFWYNTVTDDNEAAVVAQFHVKGSDIFVAEFVGKDPARTVKQVVSGHTGHFRPFDFQENSARVTKAADSNHVVLSLPASKQTATWTIPSNSGKVKVDQSGRLLIKHGNELRAGHITYVDYNDDRILFYPHVHSKDFSAVFLPRIRDGGDVHALKGKSIGFTGEKKIQAKWA